MPTDFKPMLDKLSAESPISEFHDIAILAVEEHRQVQRSAERTIIQHLPLHMREMAGNYFNQTDQLIRILELTASIARIKAKFPLTLNQGQTA
jgi:hypothetical protein